MRCSIDEHKSPYYRRGRPWFNDPLEPGAPGQEAWARIDAVDRDVRHLQLGDRAVVPSYHPYAPYDLASAERAFPLRDMEERPEGFLKGWTRYD